MRYFGLIIGISLVLITTSFTTQASPLPIHQYAQTLPNGTQVALMVEPLHKNKATVDYNSHNMMLPASTQKLITALAATLYLPSNFRFTTTFESDSAIHNKQLNGDLLIRFQGDPTLTRQNLISMIQTLKQKGINRIQGNILINNSIFTSHDKAVGWSWNNLTSCFNAPPAATIIDRNCFQVELSPAKQNNKLALTKVASQYSVFPVKIASDVITIAHDDKRMKYCELDAITKDNNYYILQGCLPKNSAKMTLSFAIQDPANYTKDIIKYELQQAGIKIKGQFIIQNSEQAKRKYTLVKHQSTELPILLRKMLKHSDNLIADTLFRTIGYRYYNMPATWRTSANAVKAILRNDAQINLNSTIIIDGSGLSRQNLISASNMMDVLKYIAKHDKTLGLMDMLPISGKDGTLIRRQSVATQTLTGHISAKTGMLDGVFNLAGFIKTQHGHHLAFVQFVSGYSSPGASRAKKRKSLMAFENDIYNKLYFNE